METRAITLERARRLRRRMTLPEVLLWQVLRRNRLGVRFRRQHPIGPYILDFYCDPARLAVEVDGQVHDLPDRIAHDERRTVWLEAQGITVVRIPARAVFDNLDGVLDGLKRRIGR